MVEKITLELSEEMLKRAHDVATRRGLPVEQVLSNWIMRGAEHDLESLIIPGAEYPIYTPIGNEAAAEIMLEALRAHKANKDSE